MSQPESTCATQGNNDVAVSSEPKTDFFTVTFGPFPTVAEAMVSSEPKTDFMLKLVFGPFPTTTEAMRFQLDIIEHLEKPRCSRFFEKLKGAEIF